MDEQQVWISLTKIWMALGGLVLCGIGFYRNNQVYNYRTKILKQELDRRVKRINKGSMVDDEPWDFDKLPGYVSMMLQFWKPVDSWKLPEIKND